MNGHVDELPPEIRAGLLRYFHVENGEFRIVDLKGLVRFIVEHGAQHPALLCLVKLDENALIERFQKTGELPPGVRVVRRTSQEGDNVTRLDIFHGPLPPKP